MLAKLKRQKRVFLRYLPLYVMLIPGSIYLFINNYIPMAGIVIAFKRYNFRTGILGSPFIGFDNFKFLFQTKEAGLITRNTILYNLTFIVLGTLFALFVAMLLYEIKAPRLKKTYQTVILLPHLISIIIVSYLVYAFLSTSTGFVNQGILAPLGQGPISWYTSPKYWPFILVIVQLWKSFGYNCILYYSTMVGIDRGYYEAAEIDGASRWQKVLHITLPCLRPTITILTLLSISRIFYSDFGLFYQVPLNQGILIDVTNTIDTYVYRGLVELNNIGMSSAASLYQAFMGFVLVVAANLLVRRIDSDSALF